MPELDYNTEQIVTGQLLARHVIYLMKRGAEAVQAERGLAVDGAAGPATRAAIDDLLAAVAPLPAPVVPKGKGMFIRNLSSAGTRAQILEKMDHCGLSWVAIQRIWQYSDPPDRKSLFYNSKTLLDYSQDLRASGHAVWLWGYPAPDKHVEFVDALIDGAVQAKAVGIIVDPEEPFLGEPAAADALMTSLLTEAAKHGLGVGMTSYGAPWNFPKFPWKSFLGAHFGMPQIYDTHNNLGEVYPKQSVQAWKQLGFKRIVPISAAFNKTRDQMTAMLAATPVDGALSWWDWFNCSEDPARWDSVRGYSF